MAGITAALANGPVHQGTDSSAYRSRCLMLIHGANLTLKRPWALQKDGDLWEYMEHIIAAKGAHALKITKVKGHVTAKHIRDGTHRLSDKVGNDMADDLAARGVGAHGDDVVHLSSF
jgi:hypothetical protein